MGAVSFMQLEAPGGRICAIGGGDLVLVVVAEAAVNVGLVRVELLKAITDLTALGGAGGAGGGGRR
jgi:predicted regulator of Ras-like GTPase activity (Roadblock/LC7/MglB family)